MPPPLAHDIAFDLFFNSSCHAIPQKVLTQIINLCYSFSNPLLVASNALGLCFFSISRNGFGLEQNSNPQPLSDTAGSPVLTWDGEIHQPTTTHSPFPPQHGQDLHWGDVMRHSLKKACFQPIPESTLVDWGTFSSGTEDPVLSVAFLFPPR